MTLYAVIMTWLIFNEVTLAWLLARYPPQHLVLTPGHASAV
jgi:hypothetical protein